MDLFLINMQLFTSQDINWWTGVVWIFVMFFISCLDSLFWRHPFTAEDPLVSKWCCAEFSKSFPMRKQTDLNLGWPESEYIFRQLFLCKPEMYSCDQSGFSYLCQGMAYVLPCTCFHQREQQQWPLVLARATAVLHLHWRGNQLLSSDYCSIYKGNRSLSFKSQYCQITVNLGMVKDWPCMSIIPGEELFSGVVTSDPYFSSLPFFFFVLLFRSQTQY